MLERSFKLANNRFPPLLFIVSLSLHTMAALNCDSMVAQVSPVKTPVTLITFDVDGTLVKGSYRKGLEVTAHSRAFVHAVGKIFAGDGGEEFEGQYSTPEDLIPKERYHGCTDGLISLNMVKYGFDIPSSVSAPRLPEIFQTMYDYIANLSDEEVVRGIHPLPGVIDKLTTLATWNDLSGQYQNNEEVHNGCKGKVMCGLVTGNVEGIARKKMRACGIYQTGVLHPRAPDQMWRGEDEHAFLGGFGSDYCSGDIDDLSRLYKDRGEQIAIAYRRALSVLPEGCSIVRVVHVGDAPSDILAAKYCYEAQLLRPVSNVTPSSSSSSSSGTTTTAASSDSSGKTPAGTAPAFGGTTSTTSTTGTTGTAISAGSLAIPVVGCVGVATGKYSADTLAALVEGTAVTGAWEPVVLADGIADPGFIDACGIATTM
mmetsp:Transcript_19478/g.33038  ORF Transcript_19478/g.33038 Transcript_19478/m.33038 type:complete len:428 (+) Transcript_19478:36-1319(+)